MIHKQHAGARGRCGGECCLKERKLKGFYTLKPESNCDTITVAVVCECKTWSFTWRTRTKGVHERGTEEGIRTRKYEVTGDRRNCVRRMYLKEMGWRGRESSGLAQGQVTATVNTAMDLGRSIKHVGGGMSSSWSHKLLKDSAALPW